MALEWTDKLSSGIEDIDAQHRHILDLLKKLVAANTPPIDPKKLIASLTEFTNALREHFIYEEALLDKAGYKDRKRHKAGHEEILETLNGITMSIMLGESDTPKDMINRVTRWFEDHLKYEDTRYFAALKKSR